MSGTCCRGAWIRSRLGYLSARPAEASRVGRVALCFDCECRCTIPGTRSTAPKQTAATFYALPVPDPEFVADFPAETLESLAEEGIPLRSRRPRKSGNGFGFLVDSHESDLREAVTAMDELTQAAARARSATAKATATKATRPLDARLAALELAPALEAHYEYRTNWRDVPLRLGKPRDRLAGGELFGQVRDKGAASIGVAGRRSAAIPDLSDRDPGSCRDHSEPWVGRRRRST